MEDIENKPIFAEIFVKEGNKCPNYTVEYTVSGTKIINNWKDQILKDLGNKDLVWKNAPHEN